LNAGRPGGGKGCTVEKKVDLRGRGEEEETTEFNDIICRAEGAVKRGVYYRI